MSFTRAAWAAAAFFLTLSPNMVKAAEFHSGRSYSLRGGEATPGDLYVAGGNSSIAGTVTGDLVAAGGNILVSGNVREDLTVAGGEVDVSGEVADDVRAAGGTVVISGKVGGDVVAAGGSVRILQGAEIKGEVYAAGSELVLAGVVGKSLFASGNQVAIGGTVEGDTRAYAGRLRTLPGATLRGNLTYTAPRKISMGPDARVLGKTSFEPSARDTEPGAGFFASGYLAFLAMALLAGILFVAIFRNLSTALVRDSLQHPGADLGRGFLTMLALPVTVVLLWVTVVGLPLGFLALFAGLALLLLAYIYAGVVLGSWIWKRARHLPAYEANVKAAAIGIVTLSVVGLIPFVGWLAVLLLVMLTFGSLLHLTYHRMRTSAPVP